VKIEQTTMARRRLLGVAATAVAGTTTLAGCGLFDDDPAPVPPPDPLLPVLTGALALAAAYDRAAIDQPDLAERLTPLAASHRAHADELTRVIGTGAPAASAAPSGAPATGTTVKELRAAEQAAQKVAAESCRTAAAKRATLVGTIAAARAAHAEALR
jgi:hypothetical protein